MDKWSAESQGSNFILTFVSLALPSRFCVLKTSPVRVKTINRQLEFILLWELALRFVVKRASAHVIYIGQPIEIPWENTSR
tara:strand:- start:454132 stop:454374 length:243 start_codon:yes stop_codon:yes gene_type:complete